MLSSVGLVLLIRRGLFHCCLLEAMWVLRPQNHITCALIPVLCQFGVFQLSRERKPFLWLKESASVCLSECSIDQEAVISAPWRSRAPARVTSWNGDPILGYVGSHSRVWGVELQVLQRQSSSQPSADKRIWCLVSSPGIQFPDWIFPGVLGNSLGTQGSSTLSSPVTEEPLSLPQLNLTEGLSDFLRA